MIGQDDEGLFINIRKLAALDVALHGPRFIIAEYAFGVVVGAVLGMFVLSIDLISGATPSYWRLALGFLLLCVAVNYVPLLLYAVSITRRGNTREEIMDDLEQTGISVRRYNVQQLLIFVPLAIPVLAIYQQRHDRLY